MKISIKTKISILVFLIISMMMALVSFLTINHVKVFLEEAVKIGFSKKEAEESVKKISQDIFLISIVATFITVLISFILIKLMVRPMEELTRAVGLFGKGKLDYRVLLKSNDEIKELADSFNEMVDGLEETQFKLTRRVRDISTLLNSAKELNFSLDIEGIGSVILYTSKEHINASSAILFLLLNEEETTLYFNLATGYSNKIDITFNIKDNFCNYLIKSKKVEKFSNIKTNCNDLESIKKLEELNCEICAPLVFKERLSGILIIGSSKAYLPYQDSDLEFLSALINIATVALESSYLHILSITDGLTKAYLRRYFTFRLEEEVERVKRYGGGISLLMIDLDHFKKVNDTYGHQAGDKILVEFVEIVRGISRATDSVARYGGEEFAIVATETSLEGAKMYADRIRVITEKHLFDIGSLKINITISIGVAGFPRDAETTQDLIKRADEALYRAKKSGRNQVCTY
ncbi:MAG: diguanylate cyclase [Candidatus Firestonebacteria bacterium]